MSVDTIVFDTSTFIFNFLFHLLVLSGLKSEPSLSNYIVTEDPPKNVHGKECENV